MSARPLRPHQVTGLDALREALLSGCAAPMFQASTGFGKTRVMAEVTLRALARGKRVLITVPVKDLVEQTVAALEDEGILDIGVMQADHMRTDSRAAVQVASVQTLQNRKMPTVDLILIDEAHRWFRFFGPMIADAKAAKIPVIGLSATPWTRGLGKHYDKLIQVITTAELIDQGFLAPFRVYAPSHPNLDGVRTMAGDFHEGDLSKAMNKPEIVADVVTTWLERGEQRPTLCFAVDRAHAKQLQLQFEGAGVRTGYIDAHTHREERADVRHRFQTGEIQVVCNVACLTTGTDWPWVSCIILARPTKSEMLFTQIVGRGLRTAAGKDDLLVLDHSDTHLNLGMVTDLHHDELDDGNGRKKSRVVEKVAAPKECPACHFLRPAKVHKCPACGFAPAAQPNVKVEDGELVEFTRAQAAADAAARREMLSVYGQLLSIARDRGYAAGWAFHKIREYFPGAVVPRQTPAPIAPTMKVLAWVKSRQIAYAKARAKGRSAA